MSFITEKTALWRTVMLALLIVSMLGPWTFDLINVPAQYPCDKPFVRLYGDFCGSPMSGFGAIVWIFGGFFYMIAELIQGNGARLLPDFITLLFVWMLVLPLLSTLLLLGKKTSRRLQFINLTACVLACLVSVTMLTFQSYRDNFTEFFYLLWGLLLYIPVTMGMVIFESLVLRSTHDDGQPKPLAA